MTPRQRILIAMVVIAGLGVAIYAALQSSPAGSVAPAALQQPGRFDGEEADLIKQLEQAIANASALESENQQLRQEIAALKAESARLEKIESDDAAAGRDPARQTLDAWMVRVNRLKQLLNQHPEEAIPEMKLLTDQNWLDVTSAANMKREGDYRMALSLLRNDGLDHFFRTLQGALAQFESDHGGAAPASVAELQPYVLEPDAPLLQQYSMEPASSGTGVRFTRAMIQDGMRMSYSMNPDGTTSTSVSFLPAGSSSYKTMTY